MNKLCCIIAILIAGGFFSNLSHGDYNPAPADQPTYGFDRIIGPRASSLQIVLNTVYGLDVSPGNIPFSVYSKLLKSPGTPPSDNFYKDVQIAVPIAVGDSLDGKYRIVATLPKMFGFSDTGHPLPPEEIIEYTPGKKLEFADGHVFAGNKFEAVVGCDIPKLTKYKIGDLIQATHTPATAGNPADIHIQQWKIVGVLAPTHTAIDRAVYIPLLTFYAIDEHAEGLAYQAKLRTGEPPPNTNPSSDADNPHPVDANGIQQFAGYDFDTKDGTVHLKVPPDQWALSAILVMSRGGNSPYELEYGFRYSTPEAVVVDPDQVAEDFPRLLTAWSMVGIIPAYKNHASHDGIHVSAIIADSSAAAVGIKRGDMLIQCDDKPLNNCLDLIAALAPHKPGDKVQIKVQRGDNLLTLDITLASPE